MRGGGGSMGRAGSEDSGRGSAAMDPVRSFERWKKKYTRRTKRLRLQRKERKRPEWQVEREGIERLVQRYPQINPSEIQRFSDFPLSKKTLRGLQEAQYRVVTEIQRQTIGLALQGKDVLGAAKTGSGKTLAFIVPALELLYRHQWTSADGLGVLIISPTRELAYQTFKVLRKVGRNHEFSAGLIIGGKDLKEESERIHNINMLICTPGRLLQHMDETSYFYASDLQMLILDEADRILDMGFADTMNAIIENLPKKRQTLLFSATQTKSVKDLARLSLKDPEYVWVHEKAKFSTPATLDQSYVVCELQQKVNMLYSFLRSHLKKKTIVFFASCKEVQYLFRVFCKLQPGLPVLALHGKQHQMKRMEVYTCFVRKKAAVLFATDIAARGLDFPAVNWVIQFDCPEDANTYIHRVGRTARYKEGGEALLVLLPSEEKGMVEQLAQKKVPVSEIKINPEKLTDIQKRLQAFLAQDQELKDKAQRCFVSYLRSVYLMKNKEVFDVFKLPLAEYALSLGLAMAPRVRFLQKARKQLCANEAAGGMDHLKETEQNENTVSLINNEGVEKCGTNFSGKVSVNKTKEKERRKETEECSASSEDAESGESESEEVSEEEEEEKEVSVPSRVPDADSVQFFEEDDDDDDDTKDLDLLTVKRRDVFGVEAKDNPAPNASKSKMKKKQTKTQEAKKILKKKFKVNTKIVFTEDGELVQQWPPVQKSSLAKADEDDDASGINLDKAKEILREEDKFDKEEYRKKIKEKHREKRLKEKAARREARNKNAQQAEEETVAYLAHSGSEEEFDPSTLPDPDKYKDSDEEQDSESEDSYSDLEEKSGRKKRSYSNSNAAEEMPLKGKKAKISQEEDPYLPLDTGLSLAEDEELVLHLLNSHS
ncbi:PREDICTED: probable ATP-dependent RNA helicase DDX10 isoform X1 [Calidris pugnax]|uniref:probable ATP-dependent RNA helicase DDX10 isoform X1 n=1 Tax=Calidris pugnax TaxID=198806 RepID=UPI00071D14B6|nr:PREDICTED: probable ATP-dependent RNA helicase DDX10 isoform X1 [Calidris pugnax]